MRLRKDLPVGGRLKFFWHRWRTMGASRRVVRWLRLGYPLQFDRDVIRRHGLPSLTLAAPQCLVFNTTDQVKQAAMASMVSQLLVK